MHPNRARKDKTGDLSGSLPFAVINYLMLDVHMRTVKFQQKVGG